MTGHHDPRNNTDGAAHSSQSSESSTSPHPAHESRHERAARVRQNQRRCRERKLAYVSSLEERLRAYETTGVQASISLQTVAKKLDLQNKRLRKICVDALGLSEKDIERSDVELLEMVKARISTHSPTAPPPMLSSVFPEGANARQSIPSGGSTNTCDGSSLYSSHATVGHCPPHIPSQKPSTPAPIQDDSVSNDPAQELLLTIAPSANCGDGLNHAGKRFCGLLQLLAYETLSTGSTSSNTFGETCGDKAVTCRVSYELLKNLIDEQDSLGLENAAFTLKDGVRIGMDGNGISVDASVLVKVLEGIKTSKVGHHLNSASLGMLLRN